MKTSLSLSALLLSLGLLAGNAQALDFGTAIGGGVGAVTGAVIGDSVGGRNGAIVGSGVGGAVGAVVGQSIGEPHYYPAPVYRGGYRVYAPPPRVVEYHYYEPSRPRGHAWGHDKHYRKHGHHHRHYRHGHHD